MQSSSQIDTANIPTPSFFNRPDALPVAQPKEVTKLNGNWKITAVRISITISLHVCMIIKYLLHVGPMLDV